MILFHLFHKEKAHLSGGPFLCTSCLAFWGYWHVGVDTRAVRCSVVRVKLRTMCSLVQKLEGKGRDGGRKEALGAAVVAA